MVRYVTQFTDGIGHEFTILKDLGNGLKRVDKETPYEVASIYNTPSELNLAFEGDLPSNQFKLELIYGT